MRVSQNQGSFVGASIIRMIVFWGVGVGPPYLWKLLDRLPLPRAQGSSYYNISIVTIITIVAIITTTVMIDYFQYSPCDYCSYYYDYRGARVSPAVYTALWGSRVIGIGCVLPKTPDGKISDVLAHFQEILRVSRSSACCACRGNIARCNLGDFSRALC